MTHDLSAVIQMGGDEGVPGLQRRPRLATPTGKILHVRSEGPRARAATQG